MDCTKGKYWLENNHTYSIKPYKHQEYPPTVLGGISPQALLDREARTHSNPNSDNANNLIINNDAELPIDDDFDPEEAWSDWQRSNSSNLTSYLAGDESNQTASDRKTGRKVKRFHSSFTSSSTSTSTTTDTISSTEIKREPKGFVSTRVEKVKISLYESYTQISPDMETCGRGNNAMPKIREKVRQFRINF